MPHLLVIDDDDGVRALLRRLLVMAGHTVVEAGDGAEGLRLCLHAPVDLVITDLMMPRMGGLDLIGQLRRHWPDMKIIAMSGGGGSGPMDQLGVARQAGAVGVLRKPFTLLELNAVVNGALKPGTATVAGTGAG